MSLIVQINAREVLDSRGNPTVEAEVLLEGGAAGRAIVPSGASTGSREAIELRDGGKRFGGQGVEKAVGNIRERIAPELIGEDALDQRGIDQMMLDLDGTPNKSKLGANALLAVSMAVAQAAAAHTDMPLYRYLGGAGACILPVPMLNIINGGKHADNKVDFQEFMIAPVGAKSFKEALRMAAETYHALKKVLKGKGCLTNVGDEGGFAPDLRSNDEAVEAILAAIEAAGYKPGKDIALGLDAAASSFFEKGKYASKEGGKKFSTEQMIKLYEGWAKKYPFVLIEDGLAEDDWKGFVELTKTLGEKVELVGDDLFVTQVQYLLKGVAAGACNSILIKLNQVGTVTETMDCIRIAHEHSYGTLISHRSGETEDTFISHLAVGLSGAKMKSGAPARTERVAKYNELLRIEESLGPSAKYLGVSAYKGKR
jgi:enolase